MRYVLIGAGPAGVITAETLRKADPSAEIVLLGGEPEPPYSRMALPYFLVGTIDETGTYLRKSEGYYSALGIHFRHSRVTGIDTKSDAALLASGDSLPYDKLLIATGASMVKPDLPGIDLPGVHPCWTLQDAREILHHAASDSHVVLMGAGFIGCIILESLLKRGVKLTVVEKSERLVPRMMNAAAGDLIRKWYENRGIRVLTSTEITGVAQSGRSDDPLDVSLDKGEPLPASLVVVATGVRPNIGFLDGSGIKTDFGVKVDNHLKTSAQNVFAAGDVAQGPDFMGGWSVHAIQPAAVDQGRIAGLNMAGGNASYHGGVAMNVLDTIGLVSGSFGRWEGVPGGTSAEKLDAAQFRYIRLEFEDDRLVGAICLGRTDQIGMVRGLIQSGKSLGDWHGKLLENPNRIGEAYAAFTGG